MITGGKLGDILGRRRAFVIGHVIYGAGSLLTALSWSVAGRSRSAGRCSRGSAPRSCCRRSPRSSPATSRARARALAYGVLGGVAGAGDRGRADPRRLGDDRADLAARVRRRGRDRDRDPARDAAAARRRAARGAAPQLDWVGSVLSRARARADRLRRAAGEQLGLARAAQLAGRAVRLLADAVRRRRRRRAARAFRAWERATRGAADASRSCTCAARDRRRCAAGWRCSSART